jgi:hypothetical protein
MNIEISNLKYASANHMAIDMDVVGFHEGETIPFTYHPDDSAPLTITIKNLLTSGNYEIAEYVSTPPYVPNSASKLGLKRAFDELGQWDNVKSMIASNSDMQEDWDLAIEIKRTDSLVQQMIAALQLTDEQVDNLLIRAYELVNV